MGVDTPDVAAAAGVFEAASTLDNALPSAYETMAKTVVKLLCDRVDLKGAGEGKAAARRGALRFQMLKTLEDHFSDPTLTATTLAARIGILRRYMDALIAEINLTFAETPMERRLCFAIASLGHPHSAHRPITEIANASGFRDMSHFSRRFRDRFGMSPRQARNTPDRPAPLDR